jgi:pilus assembly protein CpaE
VSGRRDHGLVAAARDDVEEIDTSDAQAAQAEPSTDDPRPQDGDRPVEEPVTAEREAILAYDRDGRLAFRVRSACSHLPIPPEVVPCDQPRELSRLLTSRRFSVLVAGPGLDDVAGFERLHVIREELPSMSIVLAVDETDVRIREVVRAGAIDLLPPADDAEATTKVIERAIDLAERTTEVSTPRRATRATTAPTEPDALPQRVISVASASGGCGKTFLATNIAWFLAHHGGRKVCIIDLDLQFGEVTSALRLKPHLSITDLVAAEGDLTDLFVEHCTVHESGIHVLAAPSEPTQSGLVSPHDVGRLIEAARQHFDDVIIDTPPALADNVVVAYHRSDELLVLATLDIPSIRNLQVFLSTLERLNVPDDGIRMVMNKAEEGGGVEMHQVEKLFVRGFDTTLPYAREVPRSINSGKPVLASEPDAAISRHLGDSLRRLLDDTSRAAYDAARPQSRSHRLGWRRRTKAMES